MENSINNNDHNKTYTKPWNNICIITILYPTNDHPLIIYSQDTLFMTMDAIEEIFSKPCSTGRDQDCKEIVRTIDSGGQNAHEGPCRSVVQRKLRRKQRRSAQRGNERENWEKMWFAMLLILFSTITISVPFNRSSARTLKFQWFESYRLLSYLITVINPLVAYKCILALSDIQTFWCCHLTSLFFTYRLTQKFASRPSLGCQNMQKWQGKWTEDTLSLS